jgi:hypothetical protein
VGKRKVRLQTLSDVDSSRSGRLYPELNTMEDEKIAGLCINFIEDVYGKDVNIQSRRRSNADLLLAARQTTRVQANYIKAPFLYQNKRQTGIQ